MRRVVLRAVLLLVRLRVMPAKARQRALSAAQCLVVQEGRRNKQRLARTWRVALRVAPLLALWLVMPARVPRRAHCSVVSEEDCVDKITNLLKTNDTEKST
jgi:hypothetical protein